MNIDKIRAKYLTRHNKLGSQKEALDKEKFDQEHRQIWADCDIELQARKVKLEKKTTLLEDEEMELRDLTFIFPKSYSPKRDLESELDSLKARVASLEQGE